MERICFLGNFIFMSSSQLKRAEKAIKTILEAGEPVQSAEVALALQEILDAVRSLEQRISIMENNR